MGRIGGQCKSRIPAEILDPLPKLNKAIAVQEAVEKLISEVYAGQLHPRVAASLAPLLNLQLRVLTATDLERRLQAVERLLARGGEEDYPEGHGDREGTASASHPSQKSEQQSKP